jgi:GTPase
VGAAVESIGEVDLVGVVVDASESPGAGLRYLLDLVKDTRTATVLILNKVDLVSKKRLLPMVDRMSKERDWTHIVPVSALTGDNVEHLEQVLLESLPEGEQLYPDDFLTDQPERTMVAEMVREQVLRLTHAELPFSTAVMIDQFEEVSDGKLLRIYCTIFVERDSQKPIVIGHGGALIKQIGTTARQEIERFFQTKVFLDLRVAVKEQWRDDERLLDRLGVRPPER